MTEAEARDAELAAALIAGEPAAPRTHGADAADGAPVLIYVGRLASEKNVPLALRAFERLDLTLRRFDFTRGDDTLLDKLLRACGETLEASPEHPRELRRILIETLERANAGLLPAATPVDTNLSYTFVVDQTPEQAFAAIRGEPVEVLYDEPRNPPWVEGDLPDQV